MVHRFQVKDLNLTMIEGDSSLAFDFEASGMVQKIMGTGISRICVCWRRTCNKCNNTITY